MLPYHLYFDRETPTQDSMVRLIGWVTDFVLGDLPNSAQCEGERCFDDPACRACQEGSGQAYCGFCGGWPERYRASE